MVTTYAQKHDPYELIFKLKRDELRHSNFDCSVALRETIAAFAERFRQIHSINRAVSIAVAAGYLTCLGHNLAYADGNDPGEQPLQDRPLDPNAVTVGFVIPENWWVNHIRSSIPVRRHVPRLIKFALRQTARTFNELPVEAPRPIGAGPARPVAAATTMGMR